MAYQRIKYYQAGSFVVGNRLLDEPRRLERVTVAAEPADDLDPER